MNPTTISYPAFHKLSLECFILSALHGEGGTGQTKKKKNQQPKMGSFGANHLSLHEMNPFCKVNELSKEKCLKYALEVIIQAG